MPLNCDGFNCKEEFNLDHNLSFKIDGLVSQGHIEVKIFLKSLQFSLGTRNKHDFYLEKLQTETVR